MLLEARAKMEYWRIKYNSAIFFDSHELAMYKMYRQQVRDLEELLEEF